MHLAPLYAPQEFQKTANVASREAYDAMYKRSVDDPAGFWGDIARQFHWRVVLASLHSAPRPSNRERPSLWRFFCREVQ